MDIATGARLETELPFDDPYSTRSVTGGVVTIVAGSVEYHDLRVAEAVREPVVLGPADQVLMAVVPDQVWLQAWAQLSPTAAGPGSSTSLGGSCARFASRRLLRRRDRGRHGIDRGGRGNRADETGVEDLTVGALMGVAGSSTVIFTCRTRTHHAGSTSCTPRENGSGASRSSTPRSIWLRGDLRRHARALPDG